MKRTYTTLPYTELEVADGNYDVNRVTIDRIVLHTMVGTWQGAAARFANPASQVSAHYGVTYDGTLIAWLEEFNVAYHAGSYSMNQRSIGIEHEDLGNFNNPRPDALYTKSAQLVADICKFYSIPCDNQHIIRHHDVVGAATACPDALDTDRIIREAQQILTNNTPMMLPPELATFRIDWKDVAIKDQLDVNAYIFNRYRALDTQIGQLIADATAPIQTQLEDSEKALNLEIEDLTKKLSDDDIELKSLEGQFQDVTAMNAQLTLKLSDSQKECQTLKDQLSARPIVAPIEPPLVLTPSQNRFVRLLQKFLQF